MFLLAGGLLASCSRGKPSSTPTVVPSPPSALLVSPSEVLVEEHIWAPAPSGISVSLLGVPVDENFRPLEGKGSLVPREFVDEPAATNRFTSDWREIKSEAELRASFNAWVVSGEFDANSLQRTMTLNNVFARTTYRLKAGYQIQEPPIRSHYVITAVEVGHLVQLRFQRDESALTAQLAARIKKFGADLEGLKRDLGVDAKLYAVGIRPDTGKGLLQTLSEKEFVDAFSANEEDAVPIRVRYTPVRGRALRDGALEWAKSYRVHIAPETLEITDDGTWNKTTWSLRIACLKNKTPLRRRDFTTWTDANPRVDEKGNVIDAGPRNELVVELFSQTFDGKNSVDLTKKWVEFRAEAGDTLDCDVSLWTKNNPLDSLGKTRTWDVVSIVVSDAMATSQPTTVRSSGKYPFELSFTTEIRLE